MSSTLKRHKHFEELCEKTSEDRISSLPSNLIGHILSFLPTKNAVATSVLSTRWKELWTMITHLYFDDYLLHSPKHLNRDLDALRTTFTEFVNRVLLLGRFSCIDTFRLHCVECYNAPGVNSWLASVLTCKVQELDIRVPQMNSSLLPSNLFTCTTLVKLTLGAYIYMNVPRLVLLPCVKFVDLAWVYFPDDDSITRFLDGCPVLDTLKMKRCAGPHVRVAKICNPLLRSLHLTFLSWEDNFSAHSMSLRIMLNTPFLSDLFIEDCEAEGYVVENLHELTSAHICIRCSRTSGIRPLHYHGDDAISDLLKGMSIVQKLHLFTEANNDRRSVLPMFRNMDDLVYVINRDDKFETLLNLLERSPHLRSLRTEFCYDDRNYSDYQPQLEFLSEPYHPPEPELLQQVPDCLLFHLKIIKIVNFQGYHEEVKLVEYLLKNARVLEKFIISGKSCFLERYLRMHEDLRFLPRASRLCQIEFV
ncbi:hypothetical protein DM860_017752 [Cuscuta australis]|uniref:F-box domain-containing protein n=1 Tax=Cuscuta australis TaxID=267555 RepID=A0A328DBD3_9ASTE|nr:hypothetical protein DM860_017752 [Cuscuta australis]